MDQKQTNSTLTEKISNLSSQSLIYNSTLVANRFAERNERIKKWCTKPEYDKAIQELRKKPIIRIAGGKLEWCSVPKVGSTYMKGLTNNLFGEKPLFIRKPKKNVDGVKRFFFVREPYSRLVSGYLGKIATHPVWWNTLGAYMTAYFKPLKDRYKPKCGHNVTFPEFIKYFIHSEETGRKQNIHFIPINRICDSCVGKYDYIGHLETISDDLKYIFQTVNESQDTSVLDSDAMTISGKCKSVVKDFYGQRYARCLSLCDAMKKVWWSFHVRGLISKDIEFPIDEDSCDQTTGAHFASLALKANAESRGKFDKRGQKREFLISLYSQVPLEDRVKVKELLAQDFNLFGYDAQPDYVFPQSEENTQTRT
ncbi:uncharacterized protein LOC101850294 [Aplysia californica]|uniref:Carbohydrate sulfotransferase n=1 Tax=Aplysia californica TaxID=6500 RepID=A0ABM0K8K7_APLCA|nr:uncharacterized protein LOC101850294 [Aplysia californica]